jgi:hypothetical protein
MPGQLAEELKAMEIIIAHCITGWRYELGI